MSYSPIAQAVKIATKELAYDLRARRFTITVPAPKKGEALSTKVFRICKEKRRLMRRD